MRMKTVIISALVQLGIFLITAPTVSAQVTDLSKKSYTLFNPTPRELMRDMSTDRPDQTEGPVTVDAGHIQVEADAVSYTSDKFGETEQTGISIAAINLKVGLTNYADIEFILPSYTRVKTEMGNEESTVDGAGDLVTRLKINLIGNDGGDFALGIMPIAKWPTASTDLGNDEFEWSIAVPASLALPNEFGAGATVKLDNLWDAATDDRYTSFVIAGVVGRSLSDKVGAYLDILGEKSSLDESEWQSRFSTGLTYGINGDLQLDAGFMAGLTDAMPDLQIFCGISFRY